MPSTVSARLLFILCALMAVSPEANAAVRLCKASIKTDEFKGGTEIEAKKAALDQWKARALEHGVGYDSWRIAANNQLICRREDGAHYCIARGAPCVIQQAHPEGEPARREGMPKPGGDAI